MIENFLLNFSDYNSYKYKIDCKLRNGKDIADKLWILSSQNRNDFVAQLVEQYTFNVWVLGSNPSGVTTNKVSLEYTIG